MIQKFLYEWFKDIVEEVVQTETVVNVRLVDINTNEPAYYLLLPVLPFTDTVVRYSIQDEERKFRIKHYELMSASVGGFPVFNAYGYRL